MEQILTAITTSVIGFSLISSAILYGYYLGYARGLNKSVPAKVFCTFLLLGLSLLQYQHFSYYLSDHQPLDSLWYLFGLALVPPCFYFFSKSILFPDKSIKSYEILHLLTLAIPFVVRREIAVPIFFIIGMSYCFWIVYIIYSLRRHKKRFGTELFFFGLFAVLAALVLIFGLSIPFIEHAYFYAFYANSIGIAFILVSTALLYFPELPIDISEVVKLGYANSTLKNIDIDTSVHKLEQLMNKSKLYQNENLNLSMTAEQMELTGHQLSELINTQFEVSFSKYIRQVRVEAAKLCLVEDKASSVLSIGLENGFKSQSNFYAAFKEETGVSPGNYRKSYSK